MGKDNFKIRAIITGATGMVGEGVLHECLQSDFVETVLIVNRKASGFSHPKLKEVIHADFFNLKSVEPELVNYNACFFCLGVSSVGLKEPEYSKLTYELTLNFAKTLSRLNPGMSFCYISGAGTDSTEKGRLMWARVKGKTENDLKKLPFKTVYNFRPGLLQPTKGLKNTLPYYKWLGWVPPVMNLIAPGYISTLKELGQSMINSVRFGYDKDTMEVNDIKVLSKLEVK